jgi:hypothetical protein
MLMLKRGLRVWLVLALMVGLLPAVPARAAIVCVFGSTPHQVYVNSQTDYQFTLQNTDSTDFAWLRVTVPSLSYHLVSASAPGWTAAVGSETVTFTGGTLAAGDTLQFTIRVQAGTDPEGQNNWYAQESGDPGGATTTYCENTADTSAQIDPPPTVNISNVQATDLTTNSIKITWDTDIVASSRVDYGTTAAYGSSSPTNPSMVTHHAVNLTGLQTNTAYHFRVFSDAGSGMTATSDDETFLTADVATISAGGGIPGSTVTTPNGVPTETVPPAITLATKLTGTYKTAPTFTGEASDNEAVAKVEYSVDGGKNWTVADSLTPRTVTTGKGKKAVTTTDARAVTFAFTPVLVDDGDYPVVARATDPSGNQAQTAAMTLVIDRLLPRFGASVVTIGAQAVEPASDGTLVLPAGADFRMSVSMVGGPVTAQIEARMGNEANRRFTLTRGNEAGLWLGVLSFAKPGRYTLTGQARDGAGNSGLRVLATVEVVTPVQVVGDSGVLKKAVATLYYMSPEDGAWKVWDGAAYGQKNPQPVGEKGSLSLLVPRGKYYLKVAVPGGFDTLTRSFSLSSPTPLSGRVRLGDRAVLALGPVKVPMPWTSLEPAPVAVMPAGPAPVVGGRLPLVQLPTTSGRTVSPADWYGKPTVVATMATWVPTAVEQLGALSELKADPDINVILLAQQQRAETVAAYLKIAGRPGLEAVADPDGVLSDTLTVPGVPVLYFIDRHGIIKKVMVGARSADEILSNLSHL